MKKAGADKKPPKSASLPGKAKTAIWIFAVYIFSFLCYAPLLAKRMGAEPPEALSYLRYGFVLVPALVSLVFLVCEGGGKAYAADNFKTFSLKEAIFCGIAVLTGVLTTWAYSYVQRIDLFGSAYPSLVSLAAGCAYLYVTALAEEAAWRGFFLKRMAAGGKRISASLFVGVVWAVWHIPMWSLRNLLDFWEIVPLFLWTVLLSLVLGLFYCTFENLFSVSLLHMLFNVCFLAPAGYNCAVIFVGIVIGFLYRKRKGAGHGRPTGKSKKERNYYDQ